MCSGVLGAIAHHERFRAEVLPTPSPVDPLTRGGRSITTYRGVTARMGSLLVCVCVCQSKSWTSLAPLPLLILFLAPRPFP